MKNITKKSVEKFNINVDAINLTGFTWDKYIELVPWPFRRLVCTKRQDRILETARWTGKTFWEALDILWHLVTFNDFNAVVGRLDFKTHDRTTWIAFQKAARLLEKKEIIVSSANPYFTWTSTREKKEIVFNGQTIIFETVGKFSDSSLGMEFLNGGLGRIWVDEASKPSRENSTDDIGKAIYDNTDQIYGSGVRGNYSGIGEVIPEFNCEVPMIDEKGEYILDKNGKEFPIYNDRTNMIEMVKFKTEKVYFHKTAHTDFSLNGWDPSNYLHETYFEDLWELNYELEQNLLINNSAYFEDENKDCFLMRASSWMAKACGYLSFATESYIRKLIVKNPNKAKGIVLGYVVEDDDLSKYTYRNNLRNVRIVNLKEKLKNGTLKLEDGNYPIQFLVFGLDWGFSKIKAKNSAITCTGFSRWNKDKWEFVISLGDWKAVTKSNRVDGEDVKIQQAAKFIYEKILYWREYWNYEPIVWYDLQDKIAARQVQKELEKLGFSLNFFAGAKTQAKNWGVSDRQLYFQNLLASGRFMIDPTQSRLLYKEFYDSRLASDSLLADQRSKNDAITSLGYSFTMARYVTPTSPVKLDQYLPKKTDIFIF